MNPAAATPPQPDEFAKHLAARPCRIGEIIIDRSEGGAFELRHRDEVHRQELVTYSNAEAAAEIARYDDAGKYRPLKTAPNLAHGWHLLLPDAAAVRLALDFFYPGRIAALIAHDSGALTTITLRDTLERQTGMYRVAARLSNEQADTLVARFCRSEGGCLRTILWQRDSSGAPASVLLPPVKFDPEFDQTGRGEVAIPLLCQEACNLLVAEARGVVKTAAE